MPWKKSYLQIGGEQAHRHEISEIDAYFGTDGDGTLTVLAEGTAGKQYRVRLTFSPAGREQLLDKILGGSATGLTARCPRLQKLAQMVLAGAEPHLATGDLAVRNALQVLVLAPHIRTYLEAHDPMALRQALAALHPGEENP